MISPSILDDLVEALEEARDLIAAGRRYAAYGAIDAALTKARQAPEREGLATLADAVRDSQGLPFDDRVSVNFEALCKLLVSIERPVRHVPITGTVGEPSDGVVS
jgi:hypothetical protein